MTVCEGCGTAANPQDRFCGTCGEYLSWEEEPSAAPEPVAPQTQPAGPAPSAAQPPDERSRAAGRAGAPSPDAGRPIADGPAEPPTGPSASAEGQPEAAVPGAAAPQPHPTPDGPACPSCGIGNDPARHFCRSCGTRLRQAAPPAKEPWWRRWRRRRREHAAGYRRKPRRKFHIRRFVLVSLIVSAVLLLIVFLPALPVSHPWLENLRDRVADAKPVSPSTISASSEATSAEFAFDGISNEYWAPDLEGDGVDEWVQADFAEPVRLVYLIVSPGVARDQEAFLAQARPEEVELRMFTADGGAVTETVTLADSAEPQTFELGVSDVTAVRLTVLGTYGHEPGKAVAIGELEYFIRA
ncbi:NADase-type glycan-binding domain-containing protein [Glycomyces sp. NPDC048151]|uniref:discoidin domain-containing protein n=1 Tax=Glycomyces sp. NPDC048151 TaxID=3364002 RepID=UPI0037215D80